MSKLIFFLLLAMAIYLVLRKKRPAAKPEEKNSALPEVMVSCAYCGLHVPESDSLQVGGRHYCGEEHRRLDADGRGT